MPISGYRAVNEMQDVFKLKDQLAFAFLTFLFRPQLVLNKSS